MISVTGSSGKTGRAVVRALVASDAAARALIHREDLVERMQALGAAEVVVGDLTDEVSLERALAGSSVVYHICPNVSQNEEEIGQRVIDVCKRLDVERLVYHSVLHPQIEAMPHHWAKLRVEERLIESGLSFTILQPAAYMQNLRAQWKSVTGRGVLEVPYAASTCLSMVDLADVADVAARILTENGHDGATYELCGPEVMDQHEIAAVLSSRLGRAMRVEVVDRKEWALRTRESGLGSYAIESLLAMFDYYERYGFSGNPRVLEGLLGRPTAGLGEVVERWLAQEEGTNE